MIDVDLMVAEGDVLGLVGKSGGGKSTLGKLLLGLLKPDRGVIRIAGADIAATDRRTLARQSSRFFRTRIPRSTRASGRLDRRTSARGARHRQQAGAARRAIDMLARIGLPRRYAEVYPSELSGGQRQRVAIARALVTEPRIVLLDEPTSALDVSVQSQILNLLMDLKRELGLTYLFISHNLAVIEHVASRIAVMYLGRIVETADRDALFRNPATPTPRRCSPRCSPPIRRSVCRMRVSASLFPIR